MSEVIKMSAEKSSSDLEPEVKQAIEQANSHVVKFSRPYTFEGREYEEVSLHGMETLTVKDAIAAQKKLFAEQETAALLLTETTTAYARELATKASGKPVEFFKLMPRGLSRQVYREVREFTMSNEMETENHVMKLEKPYFFDGKTYTEIDLSGVADLNSMHDSAAENRMAREGFMVTEPSFNFLYACIIASMATELPEEFFTGLPVCETVKLKNAVNDAGFFE